MKLRLGFRVLSVLAHVGNIFDKTCGAISEYRRQGLPGNPRFSQPNRIA
jgi:hypothetical protein